MFKAAQEHYSRKSDPRKIRLSPSLNQSSKISRSYNYDDKDLNSSKNLLINAEGYAHRKSYQNSKIINLCKNGSHR